MVRGLAVLVLAGTSVAACIGPPRSEFVCPRATRASAWVNKMPGVGEPSANMHVALRVDDASKPWQLRPVEEQPEDDRLVLTIVPGGSLVVGTAGYRQDIPDALPDQIIIECQSEVISVIDEVTIAQ